MHPPSRPRSAAGGAVTALALVASCHRRRAWRRRSPSRPAPSRRAASTAASALDGTWTIDHSIGSYDYAANDFSGSWAGYRAQEELVGIGGTEAVGRTPDIAGTHHARRAPSSRAPT